MTLSSHAMLAATAILHLNARDLLGILTTPRCTRKHEGTVAAVGAGCQGIEETLGTSPPHCVRGPDLVRIDLRGYCASISISISM